MKALQIALEKVLIYQLGIKKGSFELAMAEPVADKIGDVKNPEQIAEQIAKKVIENLPKEITSKGSSATKSYFCLFDYNDKKQFLMDAALAVVEKK